MPVVVLGIIGYLLYLLYQALVDYWPLVLAGIFCLFAVPKLARFIHQKWKSAKQALSDHKERECDQNDLFSRLSDKPVFLRSFHPIYPIFILIGFVVAGYAVLEIQDYAKQERWIYEIPRDYRDLQYVIWAALYCLVSVTAFHIVVQIVSRIIPKYELFSNYGALLKHAHSAKDAHQALSFAPSLREAARYHIRSSYDLFVFGHALLSKKPETAYYKNARLLHTLHYLEAYFPHDEVDENFRRRYWNYARHIFKFLHFRDTDLVEGSLFESPYPEDENIKAQDVKEQLQREREKFQNEPLDVWLKSPDEITLDDALEIIGLNEVPHGLKLHKLHLAVLEDHKDDPKKEKLTAKAFEVLGRAAVKSEMM